MDVSSSQTLPSVVNCDAVWVVEALPPKEPLKGGELILARLPCNDLRPLARVMLPPASALPRPVLHSQPSASC